jgi:hypothetical protein
MFHGLERYVHQKLYSRSLYYVFLRIEIIFLQLSVFFDKKIDIKTATHTATVVL